MKICNLVFLVFIVTFALQNSNAGDTVYYANQLKDSYVLWRVQFQPKGPKWPGHLNVKIDSVLRGSFFIDEKWETSTFGEKVPGELYLMVGYGAKAFFRFPRLSETQDQLVPGVYEIRKHRAEHVALRGLG